MIIIKDFKIYLDGGTIEIITDQGTYCFDNRLRTKTKGKLYNGMPKKR